MITQVIFDWAKRTPDKTAVIYNDRPWSYRAFADLIAVARGYFARRGYVGSGYVALAVRNFMRFWIYSLALCSLGLTTVVVPSAAELDKLGLPNIRCVITGSDDVFAALQGPCAELGVPLLLISLAGETS
jgi:acyl-CoA synthetase (AMP-forming)/AMP-acid ligase II